MKKNILFFILVILAIACKKEDDKPVLENVQQGFCKGTVAGFTEYGTPVNCSFNYTAMGYYEQFNMSNGTDTAYFFDATGKITQRTPITKFYFRLQTTDGYGYSQFYIFYDGKKVLNRYSKINDFNSKSKTVNYSGIAFFVVSFYSKMNENLYTYYFATSDDLEKDGAGSIDNSYSVTDFVFDKVNKEISGKFQLKTLFNGKNKSTITGEFKTKVYTQSFFY